MNPHCILQVDDDADDVFLLKRAFHKAGITNPVHVATDGQAAIDYLAPTGIYVDRRNYPLPDLVLLDLHLPRVHGLDVLQWIRRQPALKSLVVVLYSSLVHPRDVAGAYRLGANCVLQKPSDFRQTVDIARLIKSWWLNGNLFRAPDKQHLRPVFCLWPTPPSPLNAILAARH